MSNVTLEQNLVRPLGAPRVEPGHHVVVYREAGEGRSLYQSLRRGEAFRPRLLDRFFGSFVGYAVNAGSGLRHRFSDQLETGVGDRHDVFTVHVALVYRVAAPETLVDRLSEDPLGSLENEIRSVFRRRASQLPYEDLIDRGFDLESFLLGGDGRHDETENDVLDRFRALAQGFGIELERVEVTRTYSARKTESASRVVEAGYETTAASAEVRGLQLVEAARIQGEIELDELRTQRQRLAAQTRRQIDILDSVADGLEEITRNVSQDTRNVAEVRKLLGELTRAREDLDALVAPAAVSRLPTARAALGAGDGDIVPSRSSKTAPPGDSKVEDLVSRRLDVLLTGDVSPGAKITLTATIRPLASPVEGQWTQQIQVDLLKMNGGGPPSEFVVEHPEVILRERAGLVERRPGGSPPTGGRRWPTWSASTRSAGD